MEAQHPRFRILCTEAILRDLRPDSPCSPEFGDLLQKIVMNIKEERKSGREIIDVQACIECCLYVRDCVPESESKLLYSCRSGLSDVIAADGDYIPVRYISMAIAKNVCDQAQRELRRVNV